MNTENDVKVAPVGSARRVAARVVERVLTQGAFAMQTLDAELQRVALSSVDRALATELVYGSLRSVGGLRAALERQTQRGLPTSDAVLLSHLLVAAYQILLLDKIPTFAAVNEAVDAVRADRGAARAGFANAVLRGLSGQRLEWRDAAQQTVPAWLWSDLLHSVGEQEALALLGAGEGRTSHGVDIRVRALPEAPSPAWLLEAPPGAYSPLCRRLVQAGDPRRLEGYLDGSFAVQEEGAQIAALALGTQPGDVVLDACAGHGQKASLLAEQAGPAGKLVATDIHVKKLGQLQSEFQRLRLPAATIHKVDWTRAASLPPDLAEGSFDRILVDVPCTGSGTLRRRPEILQRIDPGDAGKLAQQSAQILRNVSRYARPGGTLLFVVCSVLRSEAEDVLNRVEDCFAPEPFGEIAGLPPGYAQASSLRLLPRSHGTDGYFIARLRRT